MRIWGWVLLSLGIVFFIFFVLAQIGGGSIGVMPWIIAGFLCLMGLNFIRSGTGLVRATPAATIGDAGTAMSGATTTTSGEVGTVEVPMSPGAVQAIKRSARWRLRTVSYVAAGMGLLLILLGAVFAVFDKTPGEGVEIFYALGSVGVATAVLIFGISWLTVLPINLDAKRAFYLRTTGPIQVADWMYGGTLGGGFGKKGAGQLLRLADRAFLVTPAESIALSKIQQGTVDYGARGHVILAAWDEQGANVYSAPGYSAATKLNA